MWPGVTTAAKMVSTADVTTAVAVVCRAGLAVVAGPASAACKTVFISAYSD